ncbi:MAG: hypothetical protein IPK32_10630 [Verrucomicrobiaceae bacterium]|nr:hypothetical protein [Verrucomicrobiaceae bacterium]
MADEAELNLVGGLPDNSPEAEKLITFTTHGSPFRVLETICKANSLTLVHDNQSWYIRPFDERDFIGKSYLYTEISAENLETVIHDLKSLLNIDKKPDVPGEPSIVQHQDSSALYITVPQTQHSWVKGYLEALSRSKAP